MPETVQTAPQVNTYGALSMPPRVVVYTHRAVFTESGGKRTETRPAGTAITVGEFQQDVLDRYAAKGFFPWKVEDCLNTKWIPRVAHPIWKSRLNLPTFGCPWCRAKYGDSDFTQARINVAVEVPKPVVVPPVLVERLSARCPFKQCVYVATGLDEAQLESKLQGHAQIHRGGRKPKPEEATQ